MLMRPRPLSMRSAGKLPYLKQRVRLTKSNSSSCMCNTARHEAIHCRGFGSHWFCHECLHHLAESSTRDVERVRLFVTCPHAQDGCSAPFSLEDLDFLNWRLLHGGNNPFYNPELYETLRFSQEEDLLDLATQQDAKCPFCKYREEYPAVEVVQDFVCRNVSECGKTSCRCCNMPAHARLTCSEAKTAAMTDRSAIRLLFQEKMSEAIIRRCG